MRSPLLSPNSPAELGMRQHSGYFDLPAYASHASLFAWNPHLPGRATYGLGPGVDGYEGAIDLQYPSLANRMQSPTLHSRPGRSPRQRAVFARDITFTPAFDLVASPLFPQSVPSSPSLPVVAPEAPAAAQTSPMRKTRRGDRFALSGTRSQAFWLVLYFAFNLGLTLYNKGVLVRFPYPYTLTAVHAFCGSLGGYVLRRKKLYTPACLDAKSYAVLAAFSVLYAVNIAVSNISLHLVTVPVRRRIQLRDV